MRFLAALLCLSWLAASSAAQAAGIGVEGHWQIRDYRVTVRKADDKDGAPLSTLTVNRGGKTIYTLSNAAIWLNPAGFFIDTGKNPGAEAADEAEQKPYQVGTDVLRLGGPTLVVQGFSLGAHCCFDVTILYLGDHFRAMPTIPLFDAGGVSFRPVKGRKGLVMSTVDFTFGYWRAPFSDSSAAPVVLGFDPSVHHYVADPGLMRAPLPAATELDARRAAAKASQSKLAAEGQSFVPNDVTQPILDLIYTGHMKEAQAFLDDVWSGSPEGRDDYWSDLTTCQMRLSQFWPAVAKLNRLKPEKPVGKCPRA